MENPNLDYEKSAKHLLQEWHRDIIKQVRDRTPELVKWLIDVDRAERILQFSKTIHGDHQQNLWIEDRMILSLTWGTTEVIQPWLRFRIDWVKNKSGKDIPVRRELSTIFWFFIKTLYSDPKTIVQESKTRFHNRVHSYYSQSLKSERAVLSRKTNRKFFEYASRGSLDGWNWPFFANLLDSVFPTETINFIEEWDYFVIFTENELFIETPKKNIIRIAANEEYRSIFRIRDTHENNSEREKIIETVSHEITHYVRKLSWIRNIQPSQTDLVFAQKNRYCIQWLWFCEAHDCPHITDEYVTKNLERILQYFWGIMQQFFPQSLSNIPWETVSRIQIYSTPGNIIGLSRLRKAIQDIDYFEQQFIRGLDCWEYAFLNWLIEDIYTKRGEKWSDQWLVYNILASIYRHILVDIKMQDNQKIPKWETQLGEWLKLIENDESFVTNLNTLKSNWLYKRWISEKMLWLWLFVKYGYAAYVFYAPQRYENPGKSGSRELSTTSVIPQEIIDFFNKLFSNK